MTAERQQSHSTERPQTPDQHPLEDIHAGTKDLLDFYVEKRLIRGAQSSRIIWQDGIETYSEHPDGSRRLVAHFPNSSFEVKERTVIAGKEAGTAKEEVTYSNPELNLKNSGEACEQIKTAITNRIQA